jgi:23S rRNA (guanine745-N1)-methyltransferase
MEPDLEPAGRTGLRWGLRLSHGDAEALVAMGPSAHHLDPAGLRAAIQAVPEPVCATASVNLSRYRRLGPAAA